jgi:hypothetical protein
VSDPKQWPDSPPSEPGWYWWAPRTPLNSGTVAVILHVVRNGLDALLVCEGRAYLPIAHFPGYWHPQRIEMP